MNLLFCLFLAFQVTPDTLTLEQSWNLALERFPVRRQIQLHEEASELRVRNLSAQYLPGFSVQGSATYQSEVPEIPFSFPGASVPSVAHDQYRVSADVEQLLYDGGQIASRQQLDRTASAMAVQQVEIESLGLIDQVNTAFFGALLLQTQLGILGVLEEDLAARLEVLKAQVEAGVVLPGGARTLEAELVKVGQDRIEMEWKRHAALVSLGVLTGVEPPDSVVLLAPGLRKSTDLEWQNRPEFKRFALAGEQYDHMADLASRRKRPRVAAFVQGALGRPPGMNIFENDVLPYYQVGVRFTWRFWDWNQAQRERDVLAIEKSMVETRRAALDDQVAVAVARHTADIERLRELLSRDDEIIALRAEVVKEAASRLENGVITATDYLIERNAQHRAELSREAHRFALEEAIARLKTTLGEVPWLTNH
jgi:outer membrane protein TolC